jgi:hypothetical protein
MSMPAEEQAFQDFLKSLELPGDYVRLVKERSILIKDLIKKDIKISGVFWGGAYRRGTYAGSRDGIKLHAVLSPKYFYECQKNSRKLLIFLRQRLTSDLLDIHIGRGGQVLTVRFPAPPDIELVPSIKLSNGNYMVSNGIGGWLKTNPARQEELFNAKEEASGGRFKSLVKLIKAWNRHIGAPFNHYFLELLIYYRVNEFNKTFAELVNSMFWSMTVFLPEFLSCPAVREPVSLGELNVSGERVEDAYTISCRALNEGNSHKALALWKSILGDDFGK